LAEFLAFIDLKIWQFFKMVSHSKMFQF